VEKQQNYRILRGFLEMGTRKDNKNAPSMKQRMKTAGPARTKTSPAPMK
jgi:hypothetical protein